MLMEQIVPRTRWGISVLFAQPEVSATPIGEVEEVAWQDASDLEAGMWVAGMAQKGEQNLRFDFALDLPVVLTQCTNAAGVEGVDLRSTSNDVVLGWDLSHTFLTSLSFGAQERGFQVIAEADVNGDALITTEELATVSMDSVGYDLDDRAVASLDRFVAMSLVQGLQVSDTNQCVIWVQ